MTAVHDAIAAHFSVQHKQAQIIAELFKADGAWLTLEGVREACGITTQNALEVHVNWIRASGVEVLTLKGSGYCLTPEGVERCRLAIVEHRARLSVADRELEAAAA